MGYGILVEEYRHYRVLEYERAMSQARVHASCIMLTLVGAAQHSNQHIQQHHDKHNREDARVQRTPHLLVVGW